MKIFDRLAPYWAWTLSAVLLGGALAVVYSTGPDARDVGTRPGQFISEMLADDHRVETVALKFPGYDLTVGATEPIDPDDLDDFPGRADPANGSYLGLSLDYETTDDYDIVTTTEDGRPDRGFSIDVYADGRRYRLPDESNGNGYLAVAGRPREVLVSVTVDGVRQTVRPSTGTRDPGKARGMYVGSEPVERRRGCGTPTVTPGFRLQDFGSRELPPCMVFRHVRTAYVDGLGWAAPGHLWQYVELSVERRLGVEWVVAGRPAQDYRSVFADDGLAVRIDGRPSAGSPRANAGDEYRFGDDARAATQVRQDAPPSTMQVVATYRRLVNTTADPDPAAPVDPDVSVTWTETLS